MSLRTIAALSALGLILGGASAGALEPAPQAHDPVIGTKPAQNGAVIVSLSDDTPGATIYYTTDGSAPTIASQRYEAPFLVASNLTVRATAIAEGLNFSSVPSQVFAPDIPADTLVWADEFDTPGAPDPTVWGYDTGNRGFGNHELETYCAAGSAEAPCDPAQPSASVAADGLLHIVGRRIDDHTFTSARLKSQGLFSFQYGRIEVRARVPEAQGYWPAFWTLGNNITTVDWPASGEQDILERVNAAKAPDWNEGSVHGVGFTGGTGLGKVYEFPAGQTAADWHTYGMIWKPGSVAYYVDDPAHPYVTYTTDDLKPFPDAKWPFDAGQSNFLLINMAIGGDWPGSPDATTPFPAEMQVDYVRIYSN